MEIIEITRDNRNNIRCSGCNGQYVANALRSMCRCGTRRSLLKRDALAAMLATRRLRRMRQIRRFCAADPARPRDGLGTTLVFSELLARSGDERANAVRGRDARKLVDQAKAELEALTQSTSAAATGNEPLVV